MFEIKKVKSEIGSISYRLPNASEWYRFIAAIDVDEKDLENMTRSKMCLMMAKAIDAIESFIVSIDIEGVKDFNSLLFYPGSDSLLTEIASVIMNSRNKIEEKKIPSPVSDGANQ